MGTHNGKKGAVSFDRASEELTFTLKAVIAEERVAQGGDPARLSAPATPHELSINLIEIEGEIYLWQTEIKTNPPGSKARSRPDSRADNKCNLVNRPVNNRTRRR